MKRLIIICEGQTEVEFCQTILEPHFRKFETQLQTPLIKKSGGGIVHWQTLKKQIVNHLNEKSVFVTTFFDFYGVQNKHDFPSWNEAKSISNKNERLDFLEKAMKHDIVEHSQYRFIPYLQLHEFEGLLFNNIAVFDRQLDDDDFINREALKKVIDDNPNPEMINDNPKTAPSVRLKNLIVGYNKVVYGNILAEDIGLGRMREKNFRFDVWIGELEKV